MQDKPVPGDWEKLKPQHILHAVKPGLFFRQPLRRAQRAAGEGVAAVGAVDEFEALADAAKDHGVLADYVAGAHGEQRDFFVAALADDASAAVDGDFSKIAVERTCDRTSKCQRRAARRIFLEAMVRFDDLDVVIVAEHLCRLT